MLLLFQCKSHQQQQYPWMEAAYGCECQFHLTRIDEQQHETEEKEMTKTNIATYKTPHSYFPFLNTGIWNGNKENHLLKMRLHMNMWKITMVHQKWDNTSQTRFKLFETGIYLELQQVHCHLKCVCCFCTTYTPVQLPGHQQPQRNCPPIIMANLAEPYQKKWRYTGTHFLVEMIVNTDFK